jgi:uncharacterized protein (DUF2147 family)
MVCSIAALLIAVTAPPSAMADSTSPLGKWTTYDDETNKAKSIIEVYEEGSTLSAKIVTVLDKKEDTPKCGVCKDELKDHPIEGLRIVWDMEVKGDKWKGGRILDPENGKIYKAKMELTENGSVLEVRGSLGPFGRTQVWKRAE